MDAFQILAPLLGVVLGGAISGAGWLWRERQERKRIVACALADLLEVRHRIVSVDIVLRDLRQRVPMPEDVSPVLRVAIDQFFPVDNGLHTRYDSAVSLLAGIDPMLAFSLRSKNTVPTLLATVRSLAQAGGATPQEVESIESSLSDAVERSLNDASLVLALAHSPATARRVKRLISRKEEMPSELNAFLGKVQHMAQANTSPQSGGA